jgi:hypothetical protein
MRVLAAGVVTVLLATVSVSLAEPTMLEKEYQKQKLEQLEADKEYQRMLKATQSRTPTAAPKADPWGSVRTPDKNSK